MGPWLCSFYCVGVPEILEHPVDDDVPVNESVVLTCRASGLGTLVYSWERSSGNSWTTVSNDNTTSYTTDTTLAIGQYMYRCRVSNDAGSVVSNNIIVNVYGEYDDIYIYIYMYIYIYIYVYIYTRII